MNDLHNINTAYICCSSVQCEILSTAMCQRDDDAIVEWCVFYFHIYFSTDIYPHFPLVCQFDNLSVIVESGCNCQFICDLGEFDNYIFDCDLLPLIFFIPSAVSSPSTHLFFTASPLNAPFLFIPNTLIV